MDADTPPADAAAPPPRGRLWHIGLDVSLGRPDERFPAAFAAAVAGHPDVARILDERPGADAVRVDAVIAADSTFHARVLGGEILRACLREAAAGDDHFYDSRVSVERYRA